MFSGYQYINNHIVQNREIWYVHGVRLGQVNSLFYAAKIGHWM
jgi:hypothetical protein